METPIKTKITVESTIDAPVEKAWKLWTSPEHIMQWNNASPDWHTPHAENDLRVGGKFTSTMAAKDGSMSFDFWGIYDEVIVNEKIESTLGDGRKIWLSFTQLDNGTHITETFEAEQTHSIEMQQGGWQAILNNFKAYAEAYTG